MAAGPLFNCPLTDSILRSQVKEINVIDGQYEAFVGETNDKPLAAFDVLHGVPDGCRCELHVGVGAATLIGKAIELREGFIFTDAPVEVEWRFSNFDGVPGWRFVMKPQLLSTKNIAEAISRFATSRFSPETRMAFNSALEKLDNLALYARAMRARGLDYEEEDAMLAIAECAADEVRKALWNDIPAARALLPKATRTEGGGEPGKDALFKI